MQQSGRHVLSHVGIYLAVRGLPGVIAFLAIPLFTRLLDPAAYGRYALAVAVISLLNALVFQWLRLSLVRYLAAHERDPIRLKSTLVTAALALILLFGILAGGLCLLPAADGWRPVLVACWAVASVQALFEMACEHARASSRPWYFMAMQFARSGAMLGLGAALLLAGFGWLGPLVGLAIGMALAVIVAYRLDWRDVRLTATDPHLLRQLLWYGVPLSTTVGLAVVVSSSDRFLLAWLIDDAAAGLYAVAADFTVQTLYLLMTAVSLALFPAVVRAWEHKGRDAAQQVMRTSGSLLLAVGVPAAVGLAVLSPGIADCFFGPSFRAAAVGIIPLVAAGALLEGFKAFHFDAAFQLAHRTLHQVWIVLLVAGTNIMLCLALIPRWGMFGAAAAGVGAYVGSLALTIAVGRRHFAVPLPGRAFAQVLLAVGTMAALLWPLRDHRSALALTAQIALGGAAYTAVLLALNFLGFRAQLSRRLRRPKASVRAAPADASPCRAGLPMTQLVEAP